jgi:MFS family permease
MIRAVALIAVFGAGAALMSLEMLGFRLVQPQFGSDIIVWGSLISVFLGGLAVGAYAGGRLADRRPSLGLLGAILGLAGLVALLMPLYADPVMTWLYPGQGAPLPLEIAGEAGGPPGALQIYIPPDMRWPTLAVGAALFLVPAVLLGMVSPHAARLLIHRLGRVGSGVGNISGISTAGAIVGTLATAFYLITLIGTEWLLRANGLVLLALGAALALAHWAAARQRHS